MAGTRSALVVATDRYESAALTQLAAPTADAGALADVLGDPELGGFDVEVVLNAPSWTIAQRVEGLLADRSPQDLVLVHFSCHGLKDESGELFLAATNTTPTLLSSTAVEAALVNRLVRRSRAARIVLVLDCCYGGAFERGAMPRAAGDVDVAGQFPLGSSGGGRGRAVITASSAMEYAFEGSRLSTDLGPQPSVFTGALVEGIRTGDADRDQDGHVSLGELYDYVYDRVRAATPHQTPRKWEYDMQGDLHIARNPHRRVAAGVLPDDLQALLSHPTTAARLGAVAELTHLAGGSDVGLAAAAQSALQGLSRDDSQRVSAAARAGAAQGAPSFPDPVVDLGVGRVGGPPLSVGIPVRGSALALTSTVAHAGTPLRVELDSGVLRVAVPTDHAGPVAATVTLSGPAGEASVDLTGTVGGAAPAAVDAPEVAADPIEDGAGRPAPSAGHRRRALLAAGALLLAGLAVVLAVLWWPEDTQRTPEDPVADVTTTVDGTQPFTATGVELEAGQRVTVTAGGEVFHRPDASTGPDGTTEQGLMSPLTTADHNALIGRIGADGELFLVGSSATFTAAEDGLLDLGVNDGGLENNSGAYTARVVVHAAG